MNIECKLQDKANYLNKGDEFNEIHNRPLRTSFLRKELVDLTKDSNKAIVLDKLISKSEKDENSAKFVQEEINRFQRYENKKVDSVLYIDLVDEARYGWMHISSSDLIEESLLSISKATMSRILKDLLDHNWINKRLNPRYPGDNTPQYRVNLLKLQFDLRSMNNNLNAYPFIMNLVNLTKE
ncbi:hypothetical protein [Vagococcus fluvialis]|uniref:hypothetical protein n=1 Tax=Vagococcus fluvialis TaxID=2738 RepID=UPI0037AF3A4B